MEERNEKNHQHLISMLNMAVNRLGSVSMVIEHLLHHLYIPSQSESIVQWRSKLQACYPLLCDKDHAKVVSKENFHTSTRRKY